MTQERSFQLTDIHEHLLFGMDDGSKSPKAMEAMLQQAAQNGIARIIATPHVTPGIVRFDVKGFRRGLAYARAYCARKGLNIRIYPGAEILYTDLTCEMLDRHAVPTLGGTNRVLVEFSPDVRFDRLMQAVENLNRTGYRVILAHVERYQCLRFFPSRIRVLKKRWNVCFQVNSHSLFASGMQLGQRGFIRYLLKKQLVDFVASDAHDIRSRPVNLRAAWFRLCDLCGTSYARTLLTAERLFTP